MNLLDQIKDAGIIGAGGAGFPTHAKLTSEAEYILMNGAECEPLLRVDQQLMAIYPDEIIKGFAEAGRLVNARQHIHQGGLTAAVLPQQGEDLTTVQGQIDAIVGDDAAETFGDVSQLTGANSFQGCHPFVVSWGAAAPVRFPDNI